MGEYVTIQHQHRCRQSDGSGRAGGAVSRSRPSPLCRLPARCGGATQWNRGQGSGCEILEAMQTGPFDRRREETRLDRVKKRQGGEGGARLKMEGGPKGKKRGRREDEFWSSNPSHLSQLGTWYLFAPHSSSLELGHHAYSRLVVNAARQDGQDWGFAAGAKLIILLDSLGMLQSRCHGAEPKLCKRAFTSCLAYNVNRYSMQHDLQLSGFYSWEG